MSRPSGYPRWADLSTPVEPVDEEKDNGFQPSTPTTPRKAFAQIFNWLFNRTYLWVKYLDESTVIPFLGDGSDGSATIAATTFSMSRHMQFQNLSVNGPSGILQTNGWVPLVRGKFGGNSGLIRCNGGKGALGASLIPATPGDPGSGPLVGGIGNVATGFSLMPPNPGPPPNLRPSVRNGLGGAGGRGGSGGFFGLFGSGWEGGSVISPSGLYSVPPGVNQGLMHWMASTIGVTMAYLRGGAGGGGGGLGAGGVGPGGGAGGGVILIPCGEADFVGVMEVKGGAGGDPVDPSVTDCGGAGGGGGGAAIVPYGRKTRLQVRVDARPGAPGLPGALDSGAGAGSTGQYGSTGNPILKEIQLTAIT